MELTVKDLITIFTLIGAIATATFKFSSIVNEMKNSLNTFTARMEEKMSHLEGAIQKIDKTDEKLDTLTQRVVKLETWHKKHTFVD